MSASKTSSVTASLAGIASTTGTTPTIAAGSFTMGINLSGMEYLPSTAGAASVAGTTYALISPAELQYYRSQGMGLIRLPISWEILQPTLGGALNAAYLTQIQTVLTNAAALGMKVILDLHDYGGYGTHKLGDGTLTNAQFAGLWSKLASAVSGYTGLGGYDLMNEPNGMPSATAWPTAAQAAITAIRKVDSSTTIYVEGDQYSSAGSWTQYNNGLASLRDPANKLVFSAHLYLDSDNSGTHTDWASQAKLGVTTQTGVTRLQNFVAWLKANNLKGDIGEIGAPDTNQNWLVSLNNVLAYAQANNLQTTYWAGGPWWGDYAMSAEPDSSGQASAQMAVLDRYTGALPTLTVTAPEITGTAAANTVITLRENSTVLGTTTSDANGDWSYTITNLANGVHTVTATQTVTGAASSVGAVSFNLRAVASSVSSGAGDSPMQASGSHRQYIVTGGPSGVTLQDTVASRDGTQAMADNSVVQFTDGIGIFDASGNGEAMAHLYQAAFDRTPDLSGLQYWTTALDSGSVTLAQVAQTFVGSGELQSLYGALSDSAFVDRVYQNVLGRAADQAGSTYWTGQLASGETRGQVLLGFAQSFENIQNTLNVAGDVNESQAYRLYQAALGRTPDNTGLSYWTTALQGGTTAQSIAQTFLNSSEFQAKYGALGDGDFVSALYQNVLGRSPDSAGQSYWTDAMQNGLGRSDVLLSFADSAENRAYTAGATHANWTFLVNQTA